MVLDDSVRSQTYIEDCEVCCKPIKIRYVFHGNNVADFNADTLGA